MSSWCKHYRAMSEHTTCKVGVDYDSVVQPNPEGPGNAWPCFIRYHVNGCSQCIYPTKEEQDAEEKVIRARQAKFFQDIADNICPHCHMPITAKRQVGRCVYADPCGHRLYQGRLDGRDNDDE